MLLVINDILLMIIGIAVMVVLFSSVFLAFIINQKKKFQFQQGLQQMREAQQNQLIEAAVRSEELERHRIAEVLHDEVGAILSSSKLHLQGVNKDNMDLRNAKLFEKSEELLNEGIHKVRTISHNLHSNILKEFGLNEAISHFVSKLTNEAIIKSSVTLDPSYTTINPENDISIYRMIQEILNNIIKHANCSFIRINSMYLNPILRIAIVHDGNGLSQEQFETLRYKKEGLGLKNIQNRMILLKGDIRFEKTDDGFQIIINVPITVL